MLQESEAGALAEAKCGKDSTVHGLLKDGGRNPKGDLWKLGTTSAHVHIGNGTLGL